MDYDPILESIKSIRGIPNTFVLEFEANFRSNLSSVDLKYLTSGSIPSHVLKNCVTSSLEHVANMAYNEYAATSDIKLLEISAMLWNPITASLFRIIPDSRTEFRKDMGRSSVKTKTHGTRPKAYVKTKPEPVNLTAIQIEGLRKRLRAVTTNRSQLYATPAHSYIKCLKPNCEFCTSVYNTLNITQCQGHKKCCSAGWYPHIGPSLWKMLKKRHDSGLPVLLTAKTCKPHEIPALEEAKVSSQDDDAISVCSERSGSTTLSASSSSNTITSCRSVKRTNVQKLLDEGMDIESIFLHGKKRRELLSPDNQEPLDWASE